MSEGPELALMYFPGNYRWSASPLMRAPERKSLREAAG